MSANSHNPVRSVGNPTVFGNSGALSQTLPMNQHPRPPHVFSQTQRQTQVGSQVMGHLPLLEPQAHVYTQAQYHAQAQAQAQPQTQARVANPQYPAQLQAQSLLQNPRASNNVGVSSPAQSQLQNPRVSNNLGVSSPSLATPGLGSAKRASQKPSARTTGSSGGSPASPMKTMELTPALRRRKRKLPEKQIPDKVAAMLPESALYTHLLDLEARIDAVMTRKKIELQESLKNPPRVQKTLRIYVFNTFTNQLQTNAENKNVEPPSWSLKIIGRILENGVDPYVTGEVQTPSSSYPKFSSFIKKITIYLDQSLYPDNHVILWESSRSPVLNEGFEVRRKGDKEFTAIIRLEMNYVPEKFKLSPALAEILGLEIETRPRILAALWYYVKDRKLQISTEPSYFMCDPPLRRLFGEEKIKFSMVSQKLSQHLTPPQPIHLEHKIKLHGNSPVGNTCYDILVDVPFQLEKEISAFLGNLDKQKEIDASEEAISAAIKKIYEHRRRRAFFLGFSRSPAEFINTLIASQSRDLKLAAGDAARDAVKEHQADFFNQSWVEDAVVRYINRKPASGSDAPGST